MSKKNIIVGAIKIAALLVDTFGYCKKCAAPITGIALLPIESLEERDAVCCTYECGAVVEFEFQVLGELESIINKGKESWARRCPRESVN